MQEEQEKNIIKEPSAGYENTRSVPKSYINPFKDWAFKKIFTSAVSMEIAKAFLNAVLAGKRVIETIEFGKNEYPGEIRSEGGAVFDFICTDKGGAKFLVEVQRQVQAYFKERTLFYTGRLISDQVHKGDKASRYDLKEVYSISLLENFCLPDSSPDQYLHRVSLCNVETGAVFYDKLHFTYIEVMKFNKKDTELRSGLDEWLYALKHVEKMTEEPQFLKAQELKQFFYLANYANLTDEEREREREILKIKWDNESIMEYAIEQAVGLAVEEAIEQTTEKTEYKKSLDFAEALLADGISTAQIAKYTKLSEEEVIALKTKK